MSRPSKHESHKRTTVSLSVETWAHLDKMARDSGRSVSEVVEWLVLHGVYGGVAVPKSDLVEFRDRVLGRGP